MAVYVCDVAPVISTPSLYHWYVVAVVELSTTSPPVQNVVGPPALIVGVDGNAFTVTDVAALGALTHPLALVTTTV